MWNKIKTFFHHLFNPHCADCRFEEQEKLHRERNLVLDEYRELLASVRLETGRLTQALVELSKPEVVIKEVEKKELKSLPRKLSMHEATARLTRESHEEAQRILRNKVNETSKVEVKSTDDEVAKMEEKLGIVN